MSVLYPVELLFYDHKEADTRLLIHLIDIFKHGVTSCLVRTVDIYVIVIIIGTFYDIRIMHTSVDICVAVGSGKSFQRTNQELCLLFIVLQDVLQLLSRQLGNHMWL